MTAWADTHPTASGPGRYVASIGPEWVLAMAPQGGIVATIAARAMDLELHGPTTPGADLPPQPLRSLQGVFVSPVPAGPVEIEVTVLRRGRSISQAQATVHAPGATTGFTALAVFGATRDGFAFTEPAFPEVPDPEGQPSFRDPPPPEAGDFDRRTMPFWEQVIEGRPAIATAPWDREAPRNRGRCALWFRFDDPPRLPAGGLDPHALMVMADVMPNAIFERVTPGEGRWFSPSADLTVHLFGPATPGWILVDFEAHLAGDGYASAEARLWDPRASGGPALVAYATQQMFFTAFDA